MDVNIRKGRVRGSQLPPEFQLGVFIESIENPRATWNTHTPACDWEGVHCDDDSGKEVRFILWESKNLRGSLDLERSPLSVKQLILGDNSLTGSINLDELPPELHTLRFNTNKLHGSLGLTNLPPSLAVLWLSRNKFSGIIDLDRLSPSMEDFLPCTQMS